MRRRALVTMLIGFLVVFASAVPSQAHEAMPFSCSMLGTAEVTAVPDDSASPIALVQDLDLAYLTLQGILAETSIELATLASENLERSEIVEFATSQIEQAEQDRETLNTWKAELDPDGQTDLNQLLATVDEVKMRLDLPAGQGGVPSFGLVSGLFELCLTDGPFDDIYLSSALDLASQQRDLAQVAAVASNTPAIVEFANEVIERESAAIGQLVTWKADDEATPAG